MDSKVMKTIYQNKICFILLLSLIISSCTESFNLQSDTYEEALVVEATITNELKKQEIKLTKTSRLEEDGLKIETGANVTVFDNKGNTFQFKEESGKYISETEFKADPKTEYTLEITTSNGKKYKSSNEVLTTENEIENIIPTVVTDSKEGRGVQIKVHSYDPANTSKYYRYEYEETYKIIAPRWTGSKLILTGPESIDVVKNSTDTRICYSTKTSNDIILTSTANLQEDRVNYQIRFISDQNYIISHRYSILVRQYVQNLQSYTFRKTMKDISSSSSILSPKQPGFINGNIKCTSNIDEKAIGFFEVSSVSSKRIFFNYSDLFPGELLPPYITDCDIEEYKFCFGISAPIPCRGDVLIDRISANKISYLYNTDRILYYATNIECGDCTSFSSNVIPSFWTN
ncbi:MULTISPECIES: DUF4249 domain-containing protein [unclassified Flavobacterium]|uniref:DUF4249 domain-containing protein n=1 Tax=unclassified Flavobacterium TaxID=196869 RepID=UPI000F0C1BDD|nr:MULTISPECIES: DUF4249 domain-containing protein [unclassified Flavobacterium]AYN02758.1 DUF4249 domain-containing protein [Flavobacterium sp. 140616W15]MCD0472965.1 DUF4249 domain-containing protein [Flavobacterium sp. EDS]